MSAEKGEAKLLYKSEVEIYVPEDTDGVCKRKTCQNYRRGVWSELANGYCVACWDKGYGFKKGDLQLGYRNRIKENYVDSE